MLITIIILAALTAAVITNRKKHDKTPGSFAYPIFFMLVKVIFANRKKAETDDALMSEVKLPYIMLCNHESFEDFYYVWRMVKKHKPDYLVNEYYARLPFLRILAVRAGVLTKKLFTREMSTGIKIHRMLKKGYPVIIFPEGRLSPDGRSNPIIESGAGLYRRLKCDLVLTRIEGAYYAHPKWRKKYYGSKVKVSVKRVLHPEELKNMTDGELEKIINSTLYSDAALYNCDSYPQKNKAEGLDGILYRCAFCKDRYTTVGRGNELFCSSCGKKLTLDDNYHFTEWPHSISGYYEEIRNAERAELDVFSLHMKVKLKVFGQSGRTEKEEDGECFLDKEKFRYLSQTEDFSINTNDIPGLAFSCKTEIELYRGENLYYFYPQKDVSQVAHWALMIDLLTESRGSK